MTPAHRTRAGPGPPRRHADAWIATRTSRKKLAVTLDAMNWVWDHSQSRGNTRLALLYVADQVRTPACEVRLGRGDFIRAVNGVKNTVRDAVGDAEKLGELVIVEPASGRRKALYRLPMAVGYARRGSDSDPLETRRGSSPDPLQPEGGSRRGSDSDPQESVEGQNLTRRGSSSDPHSPSPKEPAGARARAREPDAFQICQPLITAMTQAGITVSWSMQPADMIEIARIVERAGVPAMVAFARDTKTSARQPIRYATFFLRGGWRGLPPAASPQQSRASPLPPHCGDRDCPPDTRLREAEGEDGLPVLVPCPHCHPATQGAAP